MSRLLPAALLASVLLALVVVHSITRPRSAPDCPVCHASSPQVIVKFVHLTLYRCDDCGHVHEGPPRRDFSYVQAAQELLSLEKHGQAVVLSDRSGANGHDADVGAE